MTSRAYRLPPFARLVAFEAAARQQSFKAGAEELSVTASAVSHQIKALESQLGVALFHRHPRGVELTAEGERLFRVLARGFSELSSTLDQLRRIGTRQVVTIAATTAVSSLWLTPRLTRFWNAHGEIAVNQHVSDLLPDRPLHTDLQIGYGNDEAHASDIDNWQRRHLFDDRLRPMCSPAFQRDHTDGSLERLAGYPLIHLDTTADWTNWHSWFQSLGHSGDVDSGVRVNNYAIAVQCARDGVGVILGWERLLAPLIDSGQLVPFGEHLVPAPACFYLDSGPEAQLSEAARVLRDWLLDSV